jgi:hypothetical protein
LYTDCVSVHLLLGERGVVQARSEQDFFAQTKFQSDDDSFLAALFSVFVDMTFLRGVFGPVEEGMYSP